MAIKIEESRSFTIEDSQTQKISVKSYEGGERIEIKQGPDMVVMSAEVAEAMAQGIYNVIQSGKSTTRVSD